VMYGEKCVSKMNLLSMCLADAPVPVFMAERN
jgi:hypothetical protein